MRFAAAIAALTLIAAGAAQAQDTPEACRPDRKGQVDYRACAEAAPKGSPVRMLALINLGSEAVVAQDYEAAVRYYDEAVPPGQQVYSDALFHAFRGHAYDRVGRKAEALSDARAALTVLDKPMVAGRAPSAEMVLAYVLPILNDAKAAELQPALDRYLKLPAQDWISYANRAAVLSDIGRYREALAANAEAMKSEPGHPALLNNVCLILTKTGRAAEGLPSCEKALELAPQIAALHDTHADALAALGRCPEAQAALATARRLDPASTDYRRALACQAR